MGVCVFAVNLFHKHPGPPSLSLHQLYCAVYCVA